MGLFHLDAFTEQGERVASKDFSVPAYSQAGVNDTDLFTPDSQKRYVLKVSNSSGALQAFASVLDRRDNDLVQVADDTPRVAVNPGDTVNYYIAGVGRIENAASNTHWRTDLRFFNTSAQARDLTFQFHYTPPGETADKVVLNTLHLFPNQGVSIDDFVGTFLNQASDTDLTTGTALGVLLISSLAPSDARRAADPGRAHLRVSCFSRAARACSSRRTRTPRRWRRGAACWSCRAHRPTCASAATSVSSPRASTRRPCTSPRSSRTARSRERSTTFSTLPGTRARSLRSR